MKHHTVIVEEQRIASRCSATEDRTIVDLGIIYMIISNNYLRRQREKKNDSRMSMIKIKKK